ncbi:MAG: DUF389 domain-containing protein [Anaerolineae bacterium]|nr:DUF389 domain-containing protein [Anaerolineae bacterium]
MTLNNSSQETPTIQSRRILVPVANPVTAPGLIRMAWKLADQEHGRILALFVTVTGTEPNETTFEALTRAVDEACDQGINVDLVSHTAPSVARGVLDAVLEHGVSLIVLGFQAPTKGKIELGPVVESVARTSPCDLVVFRNPQHAHIDLDQIEHVIMPLDGSDNSKVAARLGLALADVYNAQPMAMYVLTDPDLPNWFGLARIEASLNHLKDTRQVQRQVIRASDIVRGILTRCDANDMVVLGFSERSSLDHWIFGNVAQRILAQAPGPVIITKRASREDASLTERIRQRWLARLSPTMTPSEQTAVVRQANELSLPGINFIVLMFISSLLASFGLLQNSAAVIIGAMLVAPLMSPLMSFSVGLLQSNLRLMRTALFTVLTGVLIGLVVAIVIGAIMPLDAITSEMHARGQPSLLDMGVALASGFAGAYAMARKDIPSALAGVAIAAALVPPLCTIGLGIAFAEISLASGAALLFTTNIVSISLAGALVFAWLGIRPNRENRTRRQLAIALIVLGILALPLGSTFVEVVRTGRDTNAARHTLEREFDDADVIDVALDGDTVTATVRGPNPIARADVLAAENAIEDKLGRDINLEITYWQSITP